MYRSSGDIWGIIIGFIIGAIIIFLISREFICWYWKINRIVVLLEEQNNLLKQQLGVSSNVLLKQYIPTHRVKLLTNSDGLSLRREPKTSIESFTKIPNGTEVQHINTGENVKLNDINAPWFEIRTKDGISGWCFSGSLEKI